MLTTKVFYVPSSSRLNTLLILFCAYVAVHILNLKNWSEWKKASQKVKEKMMAYCGMKTHELWNMAKKFGSQKRTRKPGLLKRLIKFKMDADNDDLDVQPPVSLIV